MRAGGWRCEEGARISALSLRRRCPGGGGGAARRPLTTALVRRPAARARTHTHARTHTRTNRHEPPDPLPIYQPVSRTPAGRMSLSIVACPTTHLYMSPKMYSSRISWSHKYPVCILRALDKDGLIEISAVLNILTTCLGTCNINKKCTFFTKLGRNVQLFTGNNWTF